MTTAATLRANDAGAGWRLGRRATCVAAVAGAGVVAWTLGDPSPRLLSDPELALLLRGMAAIKLLIAAAAGAAVLWRLGRPIATRATVGYVAGAAAMAAATVSIWQLTWLLPAAVLFHVGLFGVLCVAWADDGVAVRRRARRHA